MVSFLKENIKNGCLLQLVDLFSAEFAEKFRLHYGAQKIHHAYSGGLLEHTFSIIKLAKVVAEF